MASRREFLKKAGVGAGVVWTAPIVTSAATPAAAATCLHSFSLVIGTTATKDTVSMRLTNTSDCGSNITSFSMTVGDSRFNFDQSDLLVGSSPGIVATLVAPDGINNGARSDVVQYTFTGFTLTSLFNFRVELDADPSYDPDGDANELVYTMPGPATPQVVGATYDADGWQLIFWNNNDGVGPGTNSVITVGFDDGTMVAVTAPDATLRNSSPGTSSYTAAPAFVLTGAA